MYGVEADLNNIENQIPVEKNPVINKKYKLFDSEENCYYDSRFGEDE